ncbi:MAG: hypothetical protein JWM80_3473 [Cyanobacteria bacterium RYN_339]|nr:hypothetical protein [Cyanobacteria bacterium RYN_339]
MPTPQRGQDELVESTTQRFARVLTFSTSFARARRKELDVLWTERGKHGPKAEEFCRRVDTLVTLCGRGESFLRLAAGQGQIQALATLAQFDLNTLTAATRGLDALARELKQDPRVQAAVTGVLAAPPPTRGLSVEEVRQNTGKLVGMVKGWLNTQPPVTAAIPKPSPTPAEAPPAPKPLGPLEQKRLAFDAAIALVQGVLEKVSPRLMVVGFSLKATGMPAKRRPWEEVQAYVPDQGPSQGLQPAQIGWALLLAELFFKEARAVQVAHMAVTQWQQARIQLAEARELLVDVDEAPEARRAPMMDKVHLGKFKAAAFPLSHLHLTFRGMSPLQELFPPPQ